VNIANKEKWFAAEKLYEVDKKVTAPNL